MNAELKIGDFASSVGVTTTVVRYWHLKGIFVPQKVIGRYRYYSSCQIDGAKKIAQTRCRKKTFLRANCVVDNNSSIGLSDFESYLFGLCCADGSLGGNLLLELKDGDLVCEIAGICGISVGKHRR
jgi:hypothetical protein